MKLKLPGKRLLIWLGAIIAIFAMLGGSAYAFMLLHPWPSVYLALRDYENPVVALSTAAEKYAPKDTLARLDIPYGESDAEKLDIYLPPSAAEGERTYPAVVWLHGGAFIAGDKADVAGYLKVVSGRGYAAVSIGYTLAPAAEYPTPVAQANAALAYLKANAAKHHIDPTRIVLAGNSAGAHFAAQLAAITTDPAYAADIGVTPALEAAALKGVVLFGGIYDLAKLRLSGDKDTFLRTALWAYLGTKQMSDNPRIAQFAVNRHVTGQFPPAFISAGSADPLESQSVLLADALKASGARVETLFFPEHYDLRPANEYQFDLNVGAGRGAFNEMTEFLRAVTK